LPGLPCSVALTKGVGVGFGEGLDVGRKATYSPASAVINAATPVSIPGSVLQKVQKGFDADLLTLLLVLFPIRVPFRYRVIRSCWRGDTETGCGSRRGY
jgi:hypothetical protein